MASSSTCPSSSAHNHPHTRPGMKRKHHTWHAPVAYRSHFEDFMREIGEDAHLTHLCCVPRHAQRSERPRANSEPPSLTSIQQMFLQSEPDVVIGRRRSPKRPAQRRPSAPASMATLPAFSHARERVGSNSNMPSAMSSPKVRLPLKAPATISIDVESRTTPCLCSSSSVGQRLRGVIQAFQGTSCSSLLADNELEVEDDQEQWTPLRVPPALVPRKSTSSQGTISSPHSFSRAPSFASLDTVSSSEGPETPRGHSPLHSPVREPTSPALSYLEHTSRIRVPGVCVTCRKAGHNYPSCAVCGDTWCSRECRVVDTGGRKHSCHRRTADAAEVHVGPFEA